MSCCGSLYPPIPPSGTISLRVFVYAFSRSFDPPFYCRQSLHRRVPTHATRHDRLIRLRLPVTCSFSERAPDANVSGRKLSNERSLSPETSIRMGVLYCGEYDPPSPHPTFSTSHNHRDGAVSMHLHPPLSFRDDGESPLPFSKRKYLLKCKDRVLCSLLTQVCLLHPNGNVCVHFDLIILARSLTSG